MKKLFLFVTIVVAMFFSTSHTHADELDSQLPVEIQNIYRELDKVSEIDENGFIYINMQEAYRQKLSPQAINVGLTINQLNNQIRQEDECNKQFRRRLLPIIQVTPPSWKYTVAVAAYRLFS